MLPKFSVKKPLTVLVSMILILVLGVVSFTKMTTDLLPNMNLPYVMAYTTYPGASPEKVETTVTNPLEEAFATVSGVENITSISNENVSMVMLEFSQDTNMDSAMINLNGQVDLVKGNFDGSVGSRVIFIISASPLGLEVKYTTFEPGVPLVRSYSLSRVIDVTLKRFM